MIIKCIYCKVKKGMKSEFSQYQQKWQAIHSIEGFLGQIGGWSLMDPLKACIFAFWKDEESYQYFMDEVHDHIFINSDQQETYHSISVSLFQLEYRIQGSNSPLYPAIEKTNFIRTTISQVNEENVTQFIDEHKGMIKESGFLGGDFAIKLKNNLQFLELTRWENQIDHQNYMNDVFPNLKKVAIPEQGIFKLIDEHIIVEESWRVNKN